MGIDGFFPILRPNRLLYWGGHNAYDAETDKPCGRLLVHELKLDYPYYELMWKVNPEATKQFIEAFWSGHILNWSNLDMNRHGETDVSLNKAWEYEYEGGPVLFKSKLSWACSFINTGSDLSYAAGILSEAVMALASVYYSKQWNKYWKSKQKAA